MKILKNLGIFCLVSIGVNAFASAPAAAASSSATEAQPRKVATDLERQMINDAPHSEMRSDVFLSPQRIQWYLDQGVGINALSSALLAAIREPYVIAAENLIAKGADVNIADGRDWTVLMYAASKFQGSFITLLIQHGANIDAQDKHGFTVLMQTVGNMKKQLGYAQENIKEANGLYAGRYINDPHQKMWIQQAKEQNGNALLYKKIIIQLLNAQANPYIESYEGHETFFNIYPELLNDPEIKEALSHNKYVVEREGEQQGVEREEGQPEEEEQPGSVQFETCKGANPSGGSSMEE